MPHDDDTTARFRALLRDNHGRLQCIARSYASSGEEEDLLQDMLMQIWRSLPTFDGRSNASTWVYRIALNTAMSALRKRYAQPPAHVMAPDALLPLTAASVGNPTDPHALLSHFLAQLSPMDRAVLVLSLDDLSYAQIAEVTGLNSNAVGIRLNRIKQRFNQDYVEDHP